MEEENSASKTTPIWVRAENHFVARGLEFHEYFRIVDSIQDIEYAEPPHTQKPAKDMSFEDLLLMAKKKLLGKK